MANTGALLSHPNLELQLSYVGRRWQWFPTDVVYSFACNSNGVCAQCWTVYVIFIKSYSTLVVFKISTLTDSLKGREAL